jgi:hypothetical protein
MVDKKEDEDFAGAEQKRQVKKRREPRTATGTGTTVSVLLVSILFPI